jgi:hypothetical protein
MISEVDVRAEKGSIAAQYTVYRSRQCIHKRELCHEVARLGQTFGHSSVWPREPLAASLSNRIDTARSIIIHPFHPNN